jgi:biotin transport system substrate-specific component
MLPIRSLSKSGNLLRESALVLSGTSLIALGAQISIPVEPVPFTLQTLAVMLCGLGLGAKRGVASVVTYLGLGAAGAPIFANHLGGPTYLIGPTGGYLFSFVLVAALLGLIADRGWDKKVWSCGPALCVGIAINLGLGAGWLAHFIPGKSAWMLGVLPFVGIELGKAGIVALAVPSVRKLVP